jgi:hypothetical protein
LDNPYANKKYLEDVKNEEGEESLIWQSEYLANFVDSDLAVFRGEDIRAAVEAYPYDNFPQVAQDKHRYVQGVDLANRSDFFVATVLDVSNLDKCILVRMDLFQKKGWIWNKNTIRSNWQMYHNPPTLIDASTLGETVVEDIRDINAEGLAISSNAVKYDLVHELVRIFQEHRIAIPNDPVLIRELRYFSYEITPSKNVRIEARKGHDDCVLALSLAAKLANRPFCTGFFRGVSLGRARIEYTNLSSS